MYRKVNNEINFAAREEEILKQWQAAGVHERCLNMNPEGPCYTVYDGPPTANGKPHIGHVLTRAIKDIIPRYRRMRGDRVEFKAGWDTHGLPVELEVEKQLGIDGKEQIEAYGVEAFIDKCKENVFTYRGMWEELSERVAYSADMKRPYATYENSYIESEWWALKQLWEKGMLYKGHKVVPYCPRCGTSLSSHEVAQAYKDVKETSVFVRFKAAEEDAYFAVWTTTPWTLPSNVALCVNPDENYILTEHEGLRYYVAEDLAEAVFDEKKSVIARFRGEELVGKKYHPLLPYGERLLREDGRASHYVVSADYVTMSDGTGIVHIAPAFGEDDAQVGRRYDLPFLQLVNARGELSEECAEFAGLFCKSADPEIIEKLRRDGSLLCAREHEHSYPHCWRCDTPLIYYARNSWFIAMTKVRDQLVENNLKVHWRPDNVRTGRFGKFLENVVDWGLSRERYWGTPLPLWRCTSCGRFHCVGSIEELRAMSDNCPEDIELHKPYIDRVELNCPHCGGKMQRETEVIDCWFDSGAMPFAQYHYPFENKERFEAGFPAHFISEAQDQTRGWFYSLMAISTQLFGRSPYQNALCLGLVLDKDGAKMSKHLGNVVNPWEVISSQGADALRWYFYSNSNPWLPSRFSAEAVEEGLRKYMATVRNTLAFFTLYANIDRFDHRKYSSDELPRSVADRWILSRLEACREKVSENLDAYLITQASRELTNFVDDLSNWYVRRSRERYWQSGMERDKIDAYVTLYTCLDSLARLTAPFTPFLAEEIYQVLHGDEQDAFVSVHEARWPDFGGRFRDEALEEAMELTREVVFLGRSARNSSQMKNRQVLSRLLIADLAPEKQALLNEDLVSLIADELNVKKVELGAKAGDLLDYRFKPQLKTLGKKLGRKLPLLREILEKTDGVRAHAELQEKGSLSFVLDGEAVELSGEDFIIENKQREGFASASQNGLTVALDIELTEELRAEGYVRELISKIQHLRKERGFEVTDHIELILAEETELRACFEAARERICGEVLADRFDFVAAGALPDAAVTRDLNGTEVVVWIEKI